LERISAVPHIEIPNTPFTLETEKTRYGFIVILSAPEHFPRGVVGRPLPTEEEAESVLKNFLDRYETAIKHGYHIDHDGVGTIGPRCTPIGEWTDVHAERIQKWANRVIHNSAHSRTEGSTQVSGSFFLYLESQ
jgi:hypothetical protein